MGQGGRIFTRQAPPLHRPGGDMFGLPLPTPVRVPPALIPWTGSRLSPSIFNGDPFAGWAGRGPGGVQGQRMPNNTPRPQAIEQGGIGKMAVGQHFRSPGGPVTNSTQ